jgi:hypothetical protein
MTVFRIELTSETSKRKIIHIDEIFCNKLAQEIQVAFLMALIRN